MIYCIPFADVALSASADTFKSLCAVEAASGKRVKLRGFSFGPSDDTGTDYSLTVSLVRGTDLAGTGTAVTPSKMDENGAAAAAAGWADASGEPALETVALYTVGINSRGTIDKWFEGDAAPIVNGAHSGLLRACNRSAVAVKVSGCLYFEE